MLLAVVACLWTVAPMAYGETVQQDTTKVVATDTLQADTLAVDSAMALVDADLGGADEEALEDGSLHKLLKRKFIEGSAGFMSLVALALVLGLAFCIERIVYLTLSEVNTWKGLKISAAIRVDPWLVSAIRRCCTSARRWTT